MKKPIIVNLSRVLDVRFIPGKNTAQINIEIPENVKNAGEYLEWAAIDNGTSGPRVYYVIEKVTRDFVQ